MWLVQMAQSAKHIGGCAQILAQLDNQGECSRGGLHVQQQVHGLRTLISTVIKTSQNMAWDAYVHNTGHLSWGCEVIDARTLEHMLMCSAATASADCKPQQETSSHKWSAWESCRWDRYISTKSNGCIVSALATQAAVATAAAGTCGARSWGMGSSRVTTEQTPLARPNTAATTSHPLLPPPPAPSMAPPVPLLLPLRCTIQQQRLHILMLAPTPCSGETPAECSGIRQRRCRHCDQSRGIRGSHCSFQRQRLSRD